MNLTHLGANRVVLTVGEWDILFSYQTPVAAFHRPSGAVYKTDRFYSKTTARHVNEWTEGMSGLEEKPEEFFRELMK